MVQSESKRKGNLLLFGDFVDIETNPWFDSESCEGVIISAQLESTEKISESLARRGVESNLWILHYH